MSEPKAASKNALNSPKQYKAPAPRTVLSFGLRETKERANWNAEFETPRRVLLAALGRAPGYIWATELPAHHGNAFRGLKKVLGVLGSPALERAWMPKRFQEARAVDTNASPT